MIVEEAIYVYFYRKLSVDALKRWPKLMAGDPDRSLWPSNLLSFNGYINITHITSISFDV
jgi:hypothetical protein